MVKPDVKHNYYSDLELPTTATIDDIRKAYRKLALQYHPDRNAGREAECVPRFQAIQAANEVLSDPAIKAKYDQDRRKASLYPTASRSSGPTGNPYQATSAYPPPPRRTQPGTWQRPTPTASSNNTGQVPTGADRFTNFARPPSAGAPKNPAADRAQQFRAWQKMNNGPERPVPRPPPPPPPQRPNAQPRPRSEMPSEEKIRANFTYRPPPAAETDERATAWQHWKAQQAKEGTPKKNGTSGNTRNQTPHTQRKPTGFDPNTPGSDERAAPGAGNRYFHRHRSEDLGSPMSDFPPPPPGPPPGSTPHSPLSPNTQRPSPSSPLRPPFRSRTTDNDDPPYSEGNRQSTPYSAFIGEKTRFSSGIHRSASTKDTTKLHPEAAATSRPRSTSPLGRHDSRATARDTNSKKSFPFVQYSSSDESEEERQSSTTAEEIDSANDAPTAKAFPNRPKKTPAPPSRRFNGSAAPQTPNQMDGASSGTHTTAERPSMQQRASGTNMYATPHFPTKSDRTPFSSREWTKAMFGSASTASTQEPGRIPKWAIPSSISPHSTVARSPSSSAATSGDNYFAKPAVDKSHQERRKQNKCFTAPFTHALPTSSNGKSRSEENINTNFSPNGWNGTFTGSTDYFPPSNSSRKNSPSRRNGGRSGLRSATTDIPNGSPGLTENVPVRSFGSDGARATSSRTTGPSGNTFSHEEWQQAFKDGTWAFGAPTADGPAHSDPVSGKNDANNGPKTRVSDGAENVEPDAASAVPSYSSNVEAEPMDIDTPPPAGTPQSSEPSSATDVNKEPRLYSVPPSAWRQQQATQAKAAKKASQPAAGRSQNAAGAPTLNAGLEDLATVAPIGKDDGSGLKNLADLSSTLPFQSQPSTDGPSIPIEPQVLQTPHVPLAPEPPARLSKVNWQAHAQNFGRYLEAFHAFNRTMLTHFDARERQSQARMSNGMGWLEATGEGSGVSGGFTGFASYLKGVREDEAVRETWRLGCERHAEAVKDFDRLRERVRKMVIAHSLPEV